ncbi:hypothetical protein [Mycobacterium sp. 1245801.1]|uniref:hypothetical protein n=1 Tax=Mycobacterium sp. 1245801.1 TaxID=1834075 RepID=UPI0007FED344|nr:hypothetical protein [Mycobacterium sp. 1245801.1]OBJ24629.1 hypothetical protein A5622_11680 [Mycobacterium sp. 1245801.1]
MKHVVMFSGGIGSWATAARVIDQHGTDDVTLLFADVKGDNDNPHLGEDEDTYRFINDAAGQLGARLVTVRDGRSIWQVFHDNRFLGNARLANCSKFLKQIPCREWLDTNCDHDTTVYVGIDWTETHRLPAIRNAYLPYRAEAPLTDPPYLDKADMIAAAKAEGLQPPRLYAAGYPHNNCGGFCVRAGQAQFRLLLREHRERYLFHEAEEQKLRNHLGKDVAILRDRRGAEATPLTLRAFRERMESGGPQLDLFDEFDFGGCGCFVDHPEER